MKNLTFLTFLLFSACSGTGIVKIKTVPNSATIKIIKNDGEITDLGTSPLNASVSEVFKNSKYIHLLIEKDNYRQERVVLSRPYLDTTFDLSIKLNEYLNNNKFEENLEKVSIKIAEVYRKIKGGELSSAYKDLKSLQEEFPKLSIVNDLLGNISYMNGNYEEARKFYIRADAIQPNNFERAAILKKIDRKIIR
ncbi:tetratricopeptide repeat protein [Halobacteriovorax sp.]|uniref:tetratricopeptide repeat protein n=1 Tax=Halobacteriovorax sp. TaxID=2020862 RepID=UPI003569E7F2